jgi:hypothetical protein
MRMIPHERSLVENMEGRPFVLLGVSADETRQELAETVKEKGVNWRNWWDGEGKIQFDYGVEGYPTIFLLDTNGVVREMFDGAPPREKLDRAVERLVREAEGNAAAADGPQSAPR